MQTTYSAPFSLRRTVTDTTAAAALLITCLLLILYRTHAQSGVLTGIQTCLQLLVPSLFPFVLFSCILTTSHASRLLCRPLAPILRYVFRLPACAAPALLFGLTLGYPVGAKIAAMLYTDGRLTRSEAARLLCFCTAPGYAFSLYAGMQLTGNAHIGVLLFFSCAAAPLLFGLILAPFSPIPSPQPEALSTGYTFTEAVREGTAAMVTMCSFLVLFSSGIAVLQEAGIFRTAAALLSRVGWTVPAADTALRFLLEVTSGLTHCAYWQLSPAFAAFGLGFGGLCIHLQLLSFFNNKSFPLSITLYLLTRLINGGLCSVLYTVLSRLFPFAVETAYAGTAISTVSKHDPTLSAVLLLLSLFFLAICRFPGTIFEKHTHTKTF